MSKSNNAPIHNLPDYDDSVAEAALRNVGDQGYADMNAAVGRKSKPQAEDFGESVPVSAESPAEQRQDEILKTTGNFDTRTGEVGPDVNKLPNLAAPDFQDTLEGAVAGNVAAEKEQVAGEAPDSVIGDHNPADAHATQAGHKAQAAYERTATRQFEENQEILAHQIREYEQDNDNGKTA